MRTLGFNYIIAFSFNNYIVFVNLYEIGDETVDVDAQYIKDMLAVLVPEKRNSRRIRYSLLSPLTLEGKQKEENFLYYFYKNNPPERELLDSRGISFSINIVNGKPKLLLQYIINGDNTAIPQIVGYAYQRYDETTGELISKVLTFDEFINGITVNTQKYDEISFSVLDDIII